MSGTRLAAILGVLLVSTALADDCSKFKKGDTNKLPSKILNLDKGWGIALPLDKNGEPKPKPVGDRIQCALSSAEDKKVVQDYLYAAEDGKSVYFKVPCVGYGATSGNANTRTELKADPSQTPAKKWLPNDGTTHWLNVTESVHKLGPEGHLTITQIHGEKSDVVKVQVKKGKLNVEFKNNGEADLGSFKMGEKFTTCTRIKDGKADFWLGKEGDEPKHIPGATKDLTKLKKYWGNFMIFHAGAYSPEKGGKNDYALVQVYDIRTTDHASESRVQNNASESLVQNIIV